MFLFSEMNAEKKGAFPRDVKCESRISQRERELQLTIDLRSECVCFYFVDMETDLEGGSGVLRTNGYCAFQGI